MSIEFSLFFFFFGIKHGYQTRPRVDSVKKLGPELHGLTRVNPVQPKKNLKKIFEILIFHMKN